MLQRNKIIATTLLSCALLFSGCAKERPLKSILNNGRRLPKTLFQGTVLFQKTITDVKYAGKGNEGTPIGAYDISNKLIQFETKEKTLDIVAIDPLFKEEKAALKSTLLASFAIKHVDILRKQNSEGEDTHEEEETDTRRHWKQRSLIIIDPTHESQDSNSNESTYATTPDDIDIDLTTGSINIDVTYQLKNETQLSLRYSFLPYAQSQTYIPKSYPATLALRFGLFNTTTLSFDKYGRVLESEAKKTSVMNRWDTSKPVIYYLSKDFPEHLKPAAQHVFTEWNKTFETATGKKVLELRDNSGQQLGDLRYNLIHYDPSVDASHGILGYGPSYTHPRTGEIIKADVILYGGILKSSIARERLWTKVFNSSNASLTAEPILSTNPMNLIKGSSMPLFMESRNLKAQIKVLNPELISLISKKNNPIRSLQKARTEILKKNKNNITSLSEDVLSQISHGVSKSNLSDDELEIAILIPLLTHELGHNLGLRHNFMGSSDKAHFSEGAKSSSIMDYGFLTSEEPTHPGPYDSATIQVAYGTSQAKTEELLNENYYYCTDEEVMTSTHGMCHQFDSGNTLSEVVQSQFNRYMGSWAFNNLRNDRVYFNGPNALGNYLGRIQVYLSPLRLIYDHADAVIRAFEEQNLENLWILLKQRIEADKNSSPDNIKTITLTQGVQLGETTTGITLTRTKLERRIDLTKVQALFKEASQAKTLAYQALMTVILNETRPNYNTIDSVSGELQVRGVIYDKIVALLLAGSQTSDPLESQNSISLFSSTKGGEFRDFLMTLLSDTAISEGSTSLQPLFELSPSDANLREIALEIVVNELAVPGSNASSRRLLHVNQIQLQKSSPLLTAEIPYREKAKQLYQQFFRENLSKDERAGIKAKLQMNQIERNKAVSIAVTPAFLEGDLYYVAPVSISDLNLETASGHLIRDNLNVLEDMMDALKTVITETQTAIDTEIKKPEGERTPESVVELIGKVESLQQRLSNLNQLAENERLFLEKLYKISNGR